MEKLKAKLRYQFDNIMSKGAAPVIILLIVASFILVLLFAAIVSLFSIYPAGDERLSFTEAMWMSLMRTLDPGTMGGDEGWPWRLTMLLVTGYGIIMLSTFIGLISNGILEKFNDLRKGRSKVLEEGHVLILGWSSKVHTILSELILANENQKNPVVVILANRDKTDMEDSISEVISNTKNTKIICRSGNPIDLTDLEIANPYDSKSIIILQNDHENSDAEIIKVILAITSNRKKRFPPYHITAEIESRKNMEVAKMVGGEEVELILTDEFISWMMVQTSRLSGLSIVYTDLLDFQGDEIYFHEEPKLFGQPFSKALCSFDTSAVIGFQKPDSQVLINPRKDTIIDPGSRIIAIAEDDDKVIMNGHSYDFDLGNIRDEGLSSEGRKNILILGWNRRARVIIKELSAYSNFKCTIMVVSELKNMEKKIVKLNEEFENASIKHLHADTTDREILDGLEINNFDHLILLSYQDYYNVQEADAKTLITLLHLRNIADRWGMALNIVSEMLDVKNRELAKVTNADDFIVSDNIISLLMSQVSENKYLMRVFEQLFKAEGNEIYLKPVLNYVKPDIEMDFYTVVEAALQKDEIAIGYRVMELHRDEAQNFGIVLNPVKSKRIKFSSVDYIIILSEK